MKASRSCSFFVFFVQHFVDLIIDLLLLNQKKMMQVSNTPTPEAATPVEKFEHDSDGGGYDPFIS